MDFILRLYRLLAIPTDQIDHRARARAHDSEWDDQYWQWSFNQSSYDNMYSCGFGLDRADDNILCWALLP